jgi:hypothetical protein
MWRFVKRTISNFPVKETAVNSTSFFMITCFPSVHIPRIRFIVLQLKMAHIMALKKCGQYEEENYDPLGYDNV